MHNQTLSNQITLFQASWPIANRQTDTHKQLDSKHTLTHTRANTQSIKKRDLYNKTSTTSADSC